MYIVLPFKFILYFPFKFLVILYFECIFQNDFITIQYKLLF